MKYKVSVTQEDIDHGFIENCRNCPVSLAIRRELAKDNPKNICSCEVFGNDLITFLIVVTTVPHYKYNKFSIFQPRSVSRFIKRFDRNKSVKPFNFIMDVTYVPNILPPLKENPFLYKNQYMPL